MAGNNFKLEVEDVRLEGKGGGGGGGGGGGRKLLKTKIFS